MNLEIIWVVLYFPFAQGLPHVIALPGREGAPKCSVGLQALFGAGCTWFERIRIIKCTKYFANNFVETSRNFNIKIFLTLCTIYPMSDKIWTKMVDKKQKSASTVGQSFVIHLLRKNQWITQKRNSKSHSERVHYHRWSYGDCLDSKICTCYLSSFRISCMLFHCTDTFADRHGAIKQVCRIILIMFLLSLIWNQNVIVQI